VHCLCGTYHWLGHHFGCTRWNSYVMWVMRNLTSFRSETVLVLVLDRCMVCARRTTDSEIILDAPDGTPRWWGSSESLVSVQSEIRVIFMQDRCTVCVARTIGMDIVLGSPDGTHRWRESCGISLLSIWKQCYFQCKIGAWFVLDVP
jgi:hypothetical protein